MSPEYGKMKIYCKMVCDGGIPLYSMRISVITMATSDTVQFDGMVMVK